VSGSGVRLCPASDRHSQATMFYSMINRPPLSGGAIYERLGSKARGEKDEMPWLKPLSCTNGWALRS
jgi:hypothetical protein